jgi:hypothetical protein
MTMAGGGAKGARKGRTTRANKPRVAPDRDF